VGKKRGYATLARETDNLPDFETFDNHFERIKEKYRSSHYEKMTGWKITHAVAELLNKYSIENPDNLSRTFIERLYDAGRDQMFLLDDTLEALASLKKRGYKMGIISNSNYPGNLHLTDIENLGLAPFIDFSIFSSEFGYRKPHPKIFQAGCQTMDLPIEQIVYVGDRLNIDALGAQKAGMKPIIKNCPKRDYPINEVGTIPIIENISELSSAIASLPV